MTDNYNKEETEMSEHDTTAVTPETEQAPVSEATVPTEPDVNAVSVEAPEGASTEEAAPAEEAALLGAAE